VPHADPEGNSLALTFARELPTWKIIKESWRFYAGSVGRLNEVTTTHTKKVVVTPVTGVAELEADGEWLGLAPVEVSLLRERLEVITDSYRVGTAFT
jgi:diacylglycerol kinase family enzyme